MIYKFLLIFLGSGFGGGFRYIISFYSNKWLSGYFPIGTLIVNLLGSLLLGFLIFGFDDKELLSGNLKLLLAIGFCGGFTTFSTFSYETLMLLKDSEFFFAILNVLLNLILTLSALYLAYIITK